MREALDQWEFVMMAYSVGIVGTLVMSGWAWLGMVRAERRRDEARGR